MMELSREQTIQALKFCSNCECNNERTQTECPLINMSFCKNYLRKQSLALIKELTEENERLNERLNREARCQYDLCGQIVNLRDDVKYIKVETVRKMQERFSSEMCNYGDSIDTDTAEELINQIAKEMLEENK